MIYNLIIFAIGFLSMQVAGLPLYWGERPPLWGVALQLAGGVAFGFFLVGLGSGGRAC